MGSVKVGNKVFSSDVNGISKAKAYSTLTDQPIKSDSFSLSNRNKFLKKGGSLKALSPNKDISSFKSGYGKGVDTRGGDTNKHSQTARFKKGTV